MLAEVERAVLERPQSTRLTLLCDYDGTLTEFDPDPTVPRPSPRIAELLAQIAERDDLSFGIVSGRLIADLRTRTQLPSRVYFAGLHGLEIEVGAERWQHPSLDAARHDVRQLYERLSALPRRIPGMILEDKQASIAVHVRAVAPELQHEAIAAADGCAAEWVATGKLRRLPGKCVVEFLPNIAAHKGDATRWIARHVEAKHKQPAWVVFIGDDLTDEDAFRVIKSGIGIVVGSREPTHATHRLVNTREVCQLLALLAQHDPAAVR
jgi:trehalose 6-phosphate phosphatase